MAANPEEREEHGQKFTVWGATRESVQWAAWAYALETREDRLTVIDLASTTAHYGQMGNDWYEEVQLAERRVDAGRSDLEEETILQLDVGIE